MNPDMCCTIKSRRLRRGGGGRKGKLEEEKILRELAFHLLSQDRVSGEGGGMSALAVTRQGHRFDSEDSFPQKYFQEGWRLFTSERLFACWLIQ